MANPFPGMDPYLEEDTVWPVFQHHLVLCLYQTLLHGLTDRYRARVNQRTHISEEALFTSVIRQERQEEFVEIRQRADGKLITLLDVVSPANKTTADGRKAYLAKREECRTQRANLVEVDLVLQGQPTLDYSRDGLPEWDYTVTVTRAQQPESHEIYSTTLQKRLPRFRLPLAADVSDVVVDLHAAYTRCFDQGGFRNKLDYTKPPPGRLDEEQRLWLDELLAKHQLR